MTIRHFSGSREQGKRNIASDIMRFELQKKGKLEPAERYKMILKQKLEESRAKATENSPGFRLPGSKNGDKKLSKRTEQALKELAMKKAIKKAREMRNRVIVTPRQYANGKIDKNGKIYDIAGNVIGQVNKKNGKMTTSMGWAIGKYKPKSYMTDIAIQEAITKFSPYLLQQRKLLLMQQQLAAQAGQAGGGVWGASSDDVINIFGRGASGNSVWGGGDAKSSRVESAGVTAWGAMSNNVHGTFSDNVWGTAVDNVWGGVDSNIWGGIGDPMSGGLWGVKGPKLWGTGNGVNLLSGITNRILGLFGLGWGKKGNKEKLGAFNSFRNARSGGAPAPAPRTGGRR